MLMPHTNFWKTGNVVTASKPWYLILLVQIQDIFQLDALQYRKNSIVLYYGVLVGTIDSIHNGLPMTCAADCSVHNNTELMS